MISVKAGDVRRARKREQRSNDERRPRRPLAQLALPPGRSLVRLGGLARLPALLEPLVPSGVEDEGDRKAIAPNPMSTLGLSVF